MRKKPKLIPCANCGKMPKMFYADGFYICQCKPFFKRTHWRVEAQSQREAVEYWNTHNIVNSR